MQFVVCCQSAASVHGPDIAVATKRHGVALCSVDQRPTALPHTRGPIFDTIYEQVLLPLPGEILPACPDVIQCV